MSENFERIVLQKLDEMQEHLSKMPEIEKQVAKILAIEKQVAKLPYLEKQINRMPGMEEKINNINRVLILLESEFRDKVPALFDGYSIHQDKQVNQQKEIKNLSKKVKNNDIRISILEQKIG